MSKDQLKQEFPVLIGIDWADQKHDVCIQVVGKTQVIRKEIDHTPEALSEWVSELRRHFGDSPIAVCMEQSKGPLINFLIGHDLFVIFPINPKTLAEFRKAFRPSGAKDDPNDAELLLTLVIRHRDQLTVWKPDDEITRKINILSTKRRDAVNQRTALTNQLRSALKMYFPQALKLIGDDLYGPLSCDFLLKWTSLETLRNVRKKSIEKFYRDHHCYNSEIISKRLTIICEAIPLTSDPAVLETSPIEVKMLVNMIQQLNSSIAEYDKQIATLYPQHPNAEIFNSFPGAGPVCSARLASAFGTDPERYSSAAALQAYSGVAPITITSGKSHRVVARCFCPKFLRQSFVEYADISVQHSIWAKAYYSMQKQKGKRHNVIIRALAFKWMRIMFRCWIDKKPYDELLYIKSLQKHGSHILDHFSTSTC